MPDLSPEQWGIQSVGAREVWEETQGNGIDVNILGVSVFEEHPDLADSVEVDTLFGDNDGDAAIGSAMSSLVAGHGHGMDADGGVLGVAPDADLLVLPTEDELADAVRFSAEEGAQVILLPETDTDLTDATREAVGNGALVVGPAGGIEDPSVLTVAGADKNGDLIPGSPDPSAIELTAPGADLVAATSELGTSEVTGAPYAAAMVAGAAALLRADHPQLRPDQIRDALVEGSPPGPEGLPALHLPGAQAQASGVAEDIPLIDEDLADESRDSGGVPVWAWFAAVGAVLVIGIALVVVWMRRSTADPYGVKAERREDDERIAAERASEGRPANRRKKGGRRRRG